VRQQDPAEIELGEHQECGSREADPTQSATTSDGASDIRPSPQLPKPQPSPASREHPKSPEVPNSPELPAPPKRPPSPQGPVTRHSPGPLGSRESPMSNGQGLEARLKILAERNACSLVDVVKDKRFQLARDVRAVELKLRRELTFEEQMLVLNEWYRQSDDIAVGKGTRDQHLAAFIAELGKVRVPTGEGDTLNKALERIKCLEGSELPSIPGMKRAPESWRRLAALHREMWRLTGGNIYFLSCRDAAKASPGLRHQTAHHINSILERHGVIKVVTVGDTRPNGRASTFRYLLSDYRH
jgi:hypothetical protein